MWVSGVATFPLGFVRRINPSTTKQQTQRAPWSHWGHIQVWTERQAHGPRTPALPWALRFTRALSLQKTPGFRLVLRKRHPQGMQRPAPTCPPAAPYFLQPLSTSISCHSTCPHSLLSLAQSPSLLTYHPTCLSLLRFLCPVSAILHLPSASLRLLKPQGKDHVARHHFTWLSNRQHCPEHAVGHWYVPGVTHPGLQLATGIAELQYPSASVEQQLGWHKSFEEAEQD